MQFKNVFLGLTLSCLALGISSCSETEKTDQEATQAESAPAAVISQEPFKPWPIDSSKIITSPTGLKYYILEEGTGNPVTVASNIIANYHGLLPDGSVFDSSYDRGQPLQIGLNQVVKGWQEGIPKVKVGGKIFLIVPPDLGYGPQANGKIPANATLMFYVHLIGTY
jgi:FKBP-type peptidyl-prolyl cis-trans isomerase